MGNYTNQNKSFKIIHQLLSVITYIRKCTGKINLILYRELLEKKANIYITLTEMSKYGAKVQIMYTVGDDTHLTLYRQIIYFNV